MHKVTILSKKPLQFYIVKNDECQYIPRTKPGEVYFTEALNRGLLYLQQDKLVRLTEIHNSTAETEPPKEDSKTTTIMIPTAQFPIEDKPAVEKPRRGRRSRGN